MLYPYRSLLCPKTQETLGSTTHRKTMFLFTDRVVCYRMYRRLIIMCASRPILPLIYYLLYFVNVILRRGAGCQRSSTGTRGMFPCGLARTFLSPSPPPSPSSLTQQLDLGASRVRGRCSAIVMNVSSLVPLYVYPCTSPRGGMYKPKL